jgi:hypothetical protein
MADLIESRISEIRERLAEATPGPWFLHEDSTAEWTVRASGKIISGVVATVRLAWAHISQTREQSANANFISHSRADLEALLAEREGMKAEIERLSEHAKEWRDVANQRALEMIDLSADAERLDWLEAEHSRVDPVMRLTVKEHHFRGSPLWANVNGAREGIDTARRLAAPLDPSSAPTNDLAELFGMIARRDPSVTAELFDTREFGERAARVYAALGESDEQRVARIFDEARRQMKPKMDAELQGENITSEIMDFRMRSPDREAGSGTAAEALGKFVDEMQTNTIPAIVDMQRRRAELAIASRNRILTSSNVEELREHLRNANAYIEQLEASSHPAPSEGGGE